MAIKAKATDYAKRILRSKIFSLILLAALCVGLFRMVVAAAHIVEIHDGSEVIKVVTTYSDPHDIVAQAEIELNSKDTIDSSHLKDEINPKLVINRLYRITIHNGDDIHREDVIANTVGEALVYAGYEYDDDDYVSPAPETRLFEDIAINIEFIEYKDAVITEEIPYESVSSESGDILEGKTEIAVAGVNGQKQLTYHQKYVNGELVEETLTNEQITVEPVTEEVLIGTKKPVAGTTSKTVSSNISISASGKISQLSEPSWLQLDENGLPVNYTQVIEGSATAYSPADGSITATGRPAMPGYVAVNPNQIPYGTNLYIVSTDGSYVYGYAVAADTGGFVNSGKTVIDLFFPSANDAIQFGRRNVRIYVLD